MVNKANMRLWVKALRSGDYQQGIGYLKDIGLGGVKHCCLGVACEVAIANGLKLDVGLNQTVYNFDGRTGVLPDAVIAWLGLHSGDNDPIVRGSMTATRANDSNISGMTFEQIAYGLVETYELEETDEPAE